MWFHLPIFYLLGLLFGVWIALARETRVAVNGYRIQTSVVALLFLLTAVQTRDFFMWLDLAGLVILRMVLIPWLLRRYLQGELWSARRTSEVLSPTYALILYVVLGALGLGIGQGVQRGTTGIDFGLALSLFLISVATVAIAHHTPKQVMGILSADNGVDLAIVLTLSRFSVMAEYAIFVDVTLAALCLSIMVLRLKEYGNSHAHYFNDLKG